LSGGLSALLAEVKQESNGNGATAAELTLENVKLAWQKYVDDSEMPMATKMLFREIELSLNDHHITAKVESSLAENTIRAETGMMEHLRRHFKLLQLTFAIQKTEKIPGAAPPKYQKPLTAREKFIKMRQTNSAVQELQKRFDLRPEED